VAGRVPRVARNAKLALHSLQAKLGELQGAQEIAGLAFVVHRQLFAGKDRLLWVGEQFVPEGYGAVAFAAPLSHERQFTCGLRPEFRGQTGFERLRARGMGEILFAFAVKKFRQAEKVESISLRKTGFSRFENGIDLSEERSESAQVHLIMFDDGGKRMAGAPTQVIEINLGDERGNDVVFAMPTETRSVEHMTLELDEARGAESQPPQSARWMQQIEMCGEPRDAHRARHGETVFEQRPIEGFAVEGDQDGALGNACGEFFKERVFLVYIAEKELFDVQATGVPPGEADEEGVGAGAAGEAGGFGVEEKPLFRITHGGKCGAVSFFVASAAEKIENGR